MTRAFTLLPALVAAAPFLAAARPGPGDVPHPFLLWTREEGTELRERIRSAAVGVSMDGDGVNDRICFRHGDAFDRPRTISGRGESFRFADYCCVRTMNDTWPRRSSDARIPRTDPHGTTEVLAPATARERGGYPSARSCTMDGG
jgi:hypothetical protein